MSTIVIYTDGGYSPDRGVGWAWVAVDMDAGKVIEEDSGSMPRATRQVPAGSHYAEVYAVLRALESRHSEGVTIRTDAKMMRPTINEGLRGHLNRDLVPIERKVADLLDDKGASLEYFPGGYDDWSKRADQLANVRRRRKYGHRSRHRRKK